MPNAIAAKPGEREVLEALHKVRPAVGEVLQAVYRVENHDWIAKPWVELWNDPARAAALGAAGAAGVREHYNVQRMADAAESVYQELSRAKR